MALEHGSHRPESTELNAGSLSPFPNFHLYTIRPTLSRMTCKLGTLDKGSPKTTAGHTGRSQVLVYVRGHLGAETVLGGYGCLCLCMCVSKPTDSPLRLFLGDFSPSVWTSRDVKQSLQFRPSFPKLCHEETSAQTKQIEISPTDLVLRSLWT